MKKKGFIYFILVINLVLFAGNILIDTIYKKNYDIDLILGCAFLFVTLLFILFYIKKNNTEKNGLLNIGLFILILYNLYIMNGSLNLVNIKFLQKVPNFTNKSYQEVVKWSSKNNVIINEEYEYSESVNAYHVVYQSDINKSLFKVKEMNIIISDGKDPNREISIPDMNGMKFDEVIDFIEKNELTNVEIEYEDSDDEEDQLINQSKVGNIRRNEEIKFTFSRGNINTDEVVLKDLTNISKLRATSYLKKYKIDYELEDDFSDTVKLNYVISQSIKKGTKIKTSDEKIKLTISKGKKIKVPNLNKMSLEEIIKWANDNKIKLEIIKKYDDTIKKDKIISSNYKEGESVKENDRLVLTISKGPITMKEFSTLSDFTNWAKKYGIATSIDYEFSDSVENGGIIGFSYKVGEIIKNDDTVVVTISNGDTTVVPNFVGMKKSAIQTKCKSINLNCSFQYQNSTKTKDTAIRQSLTAESKLAKNSNISITLSNGETNSTNTSKSNTSNSGNSSNPSTGSSNSSNNSSNQSNSNSTSSENNSSKQEETCTVQTITVGRELNNPLDGNSYEEVSANLYSFFKERNINVKIEGDTNSGFTEKGKIVSGLNLGAKFDTCCPNNCKLYTIVLSK